MPANEMFLARQPILNRRQQLFAYELLFRAGRVDRAEIHSDLAATATVLHYVFAELGLEAALGPYHGFVNLDVQMLMSEALEILPRNKFTLEVLETVDITPDVVQRCRQLKEDGFRLALDDIVSVEDKHRPLMELADIVKVDIMCLDANALARTVASLKRWPVQLLAEKVDSEVQAQQCLELGFDFFQGYYFARPQLIAGRKLSHSELTVIRLLGLILDDADSAILENVFKQEPGLAVNLIRLTNSAAAGIRRPITSLRQAITLLGHRQLQRWLNLLLFASPGSGPVPSPLLQLAATRGRFMEILAARLKPYAPDVENRAFMTGVMSLMPALLRMPLAEILAPLNLAADIGAALQARAGILGALLSLSEKLEEMDHGACAELVCQLPGLTTAAVNSALTEALTWANSIGDNAGSA